MFLCVSPWARLAMEESGKQGVRSPLPWVMPEATPSEASLSRHRASHATVRGNGRLRRLLSNVGWSRRSGGDGSTGSGDREDPDLGANGKKKQRPRAIVTLSVVSMYLLAAAVLGYATLRHDASAGLD